MSVFLVCLKERSKLRVKILTPGYISEANCQFPKDIRVEGRKYEVPAEDVRLATTSGRWFYRIGKNNIKIVDVVPVQSGEGEKTVHVARVYEDPDNPLCSICIDQPKSLVFAPCGHYMSCGSCVAFLKKICPMCRVPIQQTVARDMVD